VLEVLYHHGKFGGARFSPAAGVAKNVERVFFVEFLANVRYMLSPVRLSSVCLSSVCRL